VTYGTGALESGELRLLAGLWLREPDAEMARLASGRLGLPAAEPAELAAAYAELFLLNVYPYGTVFTDLDGELNGPGAQEIASLYAANGYQPAELLEMGAPDHLGACLGFAAHLRERQLDLADFIEPLIAALEAEINLWRMEYTRWAERYPDWQAAERWLARTAKAATQLSEMRQTVEADVS
jgi:TorA maturation chaperone TorD